MPASTSKSASRLDLLLLTDETTPSNANRNNRYLQHIYLELFGELGCSEEEARAVHRRFELETYLTRIKGRDLFGVRNVEVEYAATFPHRPHLGLCDLATVARDAGHEVCILDNVVRYPFRRRQMLRVLETGRPRLVGISTTLMMDPRAVEWLVASVREASPESKIVLGGPSVRRDPALQALGDFLVFGSGEEPLLQILEALDGRRGLESIPFIAYHDESGTLRHGSAAQSAMLKVGRPYQVRAGERIPVPDWSLYRRGRGGVYALECSRGCRYNCHYCSYDRGKNVRALEDIRDELLRNAALGITKYRLADSNFTDGPPHFSDYPSQVCRLMKELDLGLQWSCYARVDNMTPALAEEMRAAGCFAVFFGVESGDDGIMRLMRKGHTVEDARRGIEIARAAGLHVHCNFIVGYPGETRETWRHTIELALETRPDSVTLGQFFADESAPVRGPRMAALGLEGEGTRWKHATMDSETADGLIAEGQRELMARGVVLGNEFQLAERMSLGLSFDESKRHFDLTRLLFSATAEEGKAKARSELRGFYLERIPRAIAAEHRIMGQLQ